MQLAVLPGVSMSHAAMVMLPLQRRRPPIMSVSLLRGDTIAALHVLSEGLAWRADLGCEAGAEV